MSATLGSAYVGTSGWAYPSWRPEVYPDGSRPEHFLRLYAERLPAVELNSTGYRLPSEEQFRRWAEQVPAGFRFAVKAPPRLVERLAVFEGRVGALGGRLGCVRVVVAAPRDDGFLALLLGSVDPALRWALDLRDPSWEGVDVSPAVRVGDAGGAAGWCYLRYRDPPWDDAWLDREAERVRALVDGGVEVFAFFRHEEEPRAPRAALRLLELVSART